MHKSDELLLRLVLKKQNSLHSIFLRAIFFSFETKYIIYLILYKLCLFIELIYAPWVSSCGDFYLFIIIINY